ncbi:NAD(P)/FAD-dependent oxidoreductase [Thiorhodovibrio frisius]|uniref:Putative NAD/FAD-binding protein n=1 Tax=Thiorhodovibrio frisius TaxID=631362 RepID=H8Z7I0_9GAMM|nr:FAD-dependent oxidoreductase [Thiorhodovibrio frisius]EIC20910.1 putative NAD/FAD-binding protein [Thiorhodovibrio frisius]WPL21969.1 protoporphyrinogen oxidase [Thiorhodovibrio frisius]
MSRKIGVIGSGIAGMASAWLLAGRHQVTLIERNDYVGGHTHTIMVEEHGQQIPVDTGFIVYNELNYPLLTRLFERLGVATREGDMSFATSIGPGEIEYSGDSLKTLFAQPKNLFNPSYLGMLADILRFNRRCRKLLNQGGFDGLKLGDFLARERLGEAFRDHYLLPMAAAIWSCPPHTMMEFPVESLARFFDNHGLIRIVQRPLWRTVVGGSHSYAHKIIADIGKTNIVHDPAVRVRRLSDSGSPAGIAAGTDQNSGGQGVEVTLASGATHRFDEVVLACHADEALAMIDQPTADESQLLGCFRYQPNQTWLHADTHLMPRRRQVWSAWNYLAARQQDGRQAVSVSYWMNRLQGLKARKDYMVSLNPLEAPRPETRIAEMTYHHPVFDQAAMDAQPALHRLQGQGGLWFCGSYFGYGFHEDGLRSAVDAVTRMGIDTDWLTQAGA